jgi:hypothetical protein
MRRNESGGSEAIRMTEAKVWTIYKLASKLTWLGAIQAKTEKEAIEIAATQSRSPQTGSSLNRHAEPAWFGQG